MEDTTLKGLRRSRSSLTSQLFQSYEKEDVRFKPRVSKQPWAQIGERFQRYCIVFEFGPVGFSLFVQIPVHRHKVSNYRHFRRMKKDCVPTIFLNCRSHEVHNCDSWFPNGDHDVVGRDSRDERQTVC
jgi:hypothetical protein